MIERLFPAGVATAESFGPPPAEPALPAEERLVARAVDKRRREFASARNTARRAFAELGVDPVPIGRGDSGRPLWPSGVVGSLTHCDGYRGAAVGFALAVRGVGIDAEPHAPLPDGVLDAVSLPAERDVLSTRPAGLAWDRLLFCAKEATYKAWNPLTERWLGFEDAHITFDVSAVPGAGSGLGEGTFSSRILIDPAARDGGPPLLDLRGRWLVADGLILAAVTL